MNTDKATPRPWQLANADFHEYPAKRLLIQGTRVKSGIKCLEDAVCTRAAGDQLIEQHNAALIVRAVNNHDALVAALEQIVESESCKQGIIERPLMMDARAALLAAKEAA